VTDSYTTVVCSTAVAALAICTHGSISSAVHHTSACTLKPLLAARLFCCTTASQDFIMTALLRGLSSWTLDLHAVAATSKPSPYLPFCLVAARPAEVQPATPLTARSAAARAAVTAQCDASGVSLSDGTCDSPPTLLIGAEEVLSHVAAAQAGHRRRHDLAVMQPGRFQVRVNV
jgi:hypothetical protein